MTCQGYGMYKKFCIILFVSIFVSIAVCTDACADNPDNHAPKLWQVGMSIGYANYPSSQLEEGNTAVGRLALRINALRLERLTCGLEVGVQNGNDVDLSQSLQTEIGLPNIHFTVKPIIDFLGTLQVSLTDSVFILLNGGVAYRQLSVSESTLSGKQQLNGELQAGLGMKITSETKVIAYYQGIYSGSTIFVPNAVGGAANGGSIKNIPTQHAGFLGVEIAL